ncbi:C2 domain-containing protein [Quillaja saponaria]|nr:C2 domain-containing protein [Quillaja saponaria]
MKLIVEVVDAHDLMPKDGEGSASPFVEVDFENQLSRTKTVPKNLHPIWNQKLVFHLDKTKSFHRHTIEVSVYNERRPIPGRNFLGRVRIPCSNIVKKGEEAYQLFQLEKKWFLSPVKGEIGLKIYIEPETKPKIPPSPSSPSKILQQSSPSSPAHLSEPSSPAHLSESSSLRPQVTPSQAEITNLTSKTFSAIAKAEVPAIDSPNSTPAESKKENSVTATSSFVAVAESSYIDPDREPTEEIKESGQLRRETAHHIRKHKVLYHPGVSIEKPPQGNPFTMRPVTQQVHPDHQEDYNLKDTNPQLGERWPNGGAYGGRGWMSGERFTSTYDLVEQMFYLYVRVVKAKDLPPSSITGSCDPYVEVKLGNYKGRTKHFEKKMHPEWNQVFSFSKDRVQSSVLEVFVKDKEMLGRDDYIGRVTFDLNEIPTRVPPDSPLAPQWYRLDNRQGEGKVKGNIMLAVWMGTQADEAFSEAWHSDAASVYGEGVFNIRSKVYVSPKLWYLRVNVIEAQDVLPNDRNRLPEVFVKAQVGSQVLRTKICPTPTTNPLWNEDLVFVAAEPFEEQLAITVEDRVHPSKDEVLGKINLPLTTFEKRLDHRPVHSSWFNLEKYDFGVLEPGRRRELRFSSRVHLRVCLEGGYHVLDESTMYISDQRPTARQLWKQPIGILEVGILGAQGLLPMKMKDGHGSTDAYCVAKYGQKWVRTRTILDTFSPKWNEQYTWEVYDPSTVITMGVFDNCHLGGGEKANGSSVARDSRIGK